LRIKEGRWLEVSRRDAKDSAGHGQFDRSAPVSHLLDLLFQPLAFRPAGPCAFMSPVAGVGACAAEWILHWPSGTHRTGLSPLGAGDGREHGRDVNASIVIEVSRATACDLLAVVADPVRWRLLAALSGGTRCVCQLQPVAAVSAPALSHHLRVLRDAGLVTSVRRGRWIDYSLAPDTLRRLCAALPTAVVADPGTFNRADDAGGRT